MSDDKASAYSGNAATNAECADLYLGGNDDDLINGGNAPTGQRDTIAGQGGNDVITDPQTEIDQAFTFNFDNLLM